MCEIGDLVRIKCRESDDDDYKFSYADEMTYLEGTVCRITDKFKSDYGDCRIPDDGYEYCLEFAEESDIDEFDANPSNYRWASSMFEPLEKPLTKTESRISYTIRDGYKLNFKN